MIRWTDLHLERKGDSDKCYFRRWSIGYMTELRLQPSSSTSKHRSHSASPWFANWGFPGGLVVKNLPANAGDTGDAGKIPGKSLWRRKRQPTPVFLPGNFHGQRSLAGYSPWSPKESDITALTHSDRRKWSDAVTLATSCSWLENHWIFSQFYWEIVGIHHCIHLRDTA